MRKTVFKRVLSLLLVVTCMMVLSVTAFAAGAAAGADATISDYISNSEKISKSVSKYFEIADSVGDKYDASYVYYTRTEGNSTKYYMIKVDSQSAAVDKINKVKDGENAADDINDITSGLEISADTDTAVTALSGFAPFISVVIGVLVVLISIGMTIFSAFDICYIAFPVFREKCEEAKQTGTGFMAGKQNKQTGETKLRFVTDDAQYAVVAADTVQSGKNPFMIYFGKRIISYIFLAILLFILLTGNITIITSLTLDIVSGILELIGNF